MMIKCTKCGTYFPRAPHRVGRKNYCSKPCRKADVRQYTNHGYKLVRNDQGILVEEHRLVMEKKLGRPLLSSELVHHDDETRDGNNEDNLVLTTRPEHTALHNRQRYAEGRQTNKKGGQSHLAKLTEREVLEILELVAAGQKKAAIARQYGISTMQIYNILSGKQWTATVQRWRKERETRGIPANAGKKHVGPNLEFALGETYAIP